MSLTEEVVTDEKRTLIVSTPHHPLANAIASYHTAQGAMIVRATHIPPRIGTRIYRCFCLTTIKHLADDALALSSLPAVILVVSVKPPLGPKDANSIRRVIDRFPQTKIAVIPRGEYQVSSMIERLIHFSFDETLRSMVLGQTIETTLPYKSTSKHAPVRKMSWKDWYVWFIRKPRRAIGMIFTLVVLAHTMFLLPLTFACAGVLLQATHDVSALALKQQDRFAHVRAQIAVAKRLYQPIRKGWLFVGLASYPENLMEVTESIVRLYDGASMMQQDVAIIMTKMLDPKAVAQDQILQKKSALEKNLRIMQTDIRTIVSKTPPSLLSLQNADAILARLDEYIEYGLRGLASFDTLFAKDTNRLYALFFANDKELRPGGGFIGSFALIRISNLQIREWKTYDVYDADGQLKARVAPPEAISEYLRQPFFFLRDSAFAPDHPTNMLLAEDFLQKELGIEKIDGAALITFASIESLLKNVGPVYISEFQDTVSYESAYIKTQMYAEHESFAGSIQKKDFLQALTTELFMKISDPGMAVQALESVRNSLNQKNITLYVKDPQIQSLLDTLYWSGRQLPPSCVTQQVPRATVCVPLYLFPVEANLGVNKANAFVSRTYAYTIRVAPDGTVTSTLATTFNNTSYPKTYPGGSYKNYYQLYIPPTSSIQSMLIDDIIPTNPDIEKDKYTRIGLWFEVPEQAKRTVTVSYRANTKLTPSDSQLQLIFQKQIGVPPSGIAVNIELPASYVVQETNFSPLAQEGVVEYNSTIDSDKLYYIHF